MSTTKKLKGWVDSDDPMLLNEHQHSNSDVPATLVLHGSGEHKEMFTAEEVGEILREAALTINDRGAVDVRTIINIAAKHGITL